MKKLWITLACLVVIIIGLDRVGVVVTNLALEGALRDKLLLQSKPKVRVHGIPFLTQVFGGKYGDIEADASGLDAQKLHNLTAKVKLRGVHVSITDLGKWDFTTIPIDHATAATSGASAANRSTFSKGGDWLRTSWVANRACVMISSGNNVCAHDTPDDPVSAGFMPRRRTGIGGS